MTFYQNFSYAELAKCMDPALVIILSEHLSLAVEHPEYLPHSNYVSQSHAAWLMASSGFAELEKEFIDRLREWLTKWQQRFEIENTAQIVADGAKAAKKITGTKEKEFQLKNLYHGTVHLMIGDAQKHVVTLNSRIELLQEKLRKMWHKDCPSDSYSKILPSIESAFQNYEETFFDSIRNSMTSYAMKEFAYAINSKENSNSILNFYLSKIFGYISKISYSLCKFYTKKWFLYAGGFSNRQNSLPLG